MRSKRYSLRFALPAIIIVGSVAVFGGGAGPAEAAGVTSYAVSASLNAKAKPVAIAVDDTAHVVYAIDDVNSVVSVLQAPTGLLTAVPLAMDTEPFDLAVDSATHTAYIATKNADVLVFNGFTLTRTISTPTDPTAIAFDPVSSTLYIGLSGQRLMIVHGGSTTTITSGGGDATSIAIDESSGRAYLATTSGKVVEVEAGSVAATVSISANPLFGIAVDSTNHVAYTYTKGSNRISKVSGTAVSSQALQGTIDSVKAVGVEQTDGVPYIATSFGVESIQGRISRSVEYAPTADGGQIAINQTTGVVYVSGLTHPTVTIVGDNTLLATLNAGSTPGVIAVDSTTRTAFASGESVARLSVISSTTSPEITGSTTSPGAVGADYSGSIVATGYPTPTFSVTAGALPDGLHLDSTTGAISGKPTAPGTAAFTVTAANGAAPDATAEFSIVIDAAAIVTPTPTPPVTTPPATGGGGGGDGSGSGSGSGSGTSSGTSGAHLANTGLSTGTVGGIGAIAVVLLVLGVMGITRKPKVHEPR